MSWNDVELKEFYDRWQRRGEISVTLGFAGSATWLASTIPTQRTTHVNIWPPLLGTMFVVGLYFIAAAETHRLWLPGRKALESTTQVRQSEHTYDQFFMEKEGNRSEQRMADALERLATAVERLIERMG